MAEEACEAGEAVRAQAFKERTTKAAKKQIQAYRDEPSLDPKMGDPLLWWKTHEARFPLLALLAHDYLAMPASSSSLERLFSRFARVVNPQRNKIASDVAIDIIWAHENLRRGVI